MTTAIKPRWIGFDDLLIGLGKKHAKISGDGDLGQRTALNEMLEALQWGAWLSRTTAPEQFTFCDREHDIPLGDGNIIDCQFWRYFHDAYTVPGGAPYEQLARGGPWATRFWDRDGFEFGLAGDHNGAVLGRVRGVEVWALTGEFAKPGPGRQKGSKGRGDPKDYQTAVARIIAEVDAEHSLEDKLAARKDGIRREKFVVDANDKSPTRENAAKHIRAILKGHGYDKDELKRRFN